MTDTNRSILKDCIISGFADEIAVRMDEQIELLNRLGIKWIELRSADGINIADMTAEAARELQKKLAANGIRVSALGSPIGKIGVGDEFEPHFAKFEHVAQLADIFETKNIRIFSFYTPKGEKPEKYRDEVMRRISLLADYAVSHGLVLLHENEKGIYGDMVVRCLDLMKEFYGEHFGCTFDFANFVQCRQDTEEAYEMLKPYINYVHVKDALWEDGKVVPGGQGDGKLAQIFSRLDASGYSGFLSLEPHLVDFSGLQNLEQTVEKRGRTDGEAAFEEAYQALLGLLT